MQKVAFLCTTPLEKFSKDIFSIYGKQYFQWVHDMAMLRNEKMLCKEIVEIYGEHMPYAGQDVFDSKGQNLQILYVQSNCRQLLEKVFCQADLVVMGLPVHKEELDKLFMSVFPWKDQIMFLWDNYRCQESSILKKLCREYKLREEQLVEIKRGAAKNWIRF